ncbi:histone-lysine N-methyltransferase eggless isoform X2 [Solenopsis invicta]|uniref:histone-lysine N-methyltransferase eggless isoform X2 n=1 Tax=Solenopsis invicta TaxID=13686 RepID=UPI0005963A1F|nr:histone-lysine N-methyltransferase eggless isoform X2 [Solenopsis invicta]
MVMANNKSVINLLQEVLIKEGCAPSYNFEEKSTNTIDRQFLCNVSCKELNASGIGISKKEAKQNAAKNMLLLLISKNKTSLLGDTLSLSSVANTGQSFAKVYETSSSYKQSNTVCNYVGKLQEFCQQQKINPKDILYELISEEGPRHLRTFTIRVNVGSLHESGTATCKKLAKQEAAKKLLTCLKSNTANINTTNLDNSNVAIINAVNLDKVKSNVANTNILDTNQEVISTKSNIDKKTLANRIQDSDTKVKCVTEKTSLVAELSKKESFNQKIKEPTQAPSMEVIELMSDEDEKNDGKIKSKVCNSNCVNFKCSSGINMKLAPSFACSFYGVSLEKKKKRMICEECFNTALKHQKQLVKAFVEQKPLLDCNFPDHTMEVEISDSDESDDEKKREPDNNEYIPEDVLSDIQDKLDDTLSYIYKKYNVEQHAKVACESLKKRWQNICAANDSLNTEIRGVMRTMDKLRNNLYEDFRPQIKMIEELQISDAITENAHSFVATKKVTQVRVPPSSLQDNQLEVLAIEPSSNKQTKVLNLPPTGPLVKRPPEIDDIVYIMKNAVVPWIKAKVQNIFSTNPWAIRVKFLQKKYNSAMKTVSGKHLAITEISKVMIPVGTRVVAIFRDTCSNNYYSGIIAETPKSINKYRYLVFFDDGYAQYVVHNDIFLVWETSSRVWEDIPNESREFVKKYLESYPERPMVKLQPGQMVKTEWNGKWWLARVVQVDASLVQMHFDADRRTEWIYRGSTRLGPLFIEVLKANTRQLQQSGSAHTRHRIPATFNKTNLPYVEYTSNVEEDVQTQNVQAEKTTVATSVASSTPSAPQQPRAVAKKSTAKRPNNVDTSTYNSIVETKPSHSIVFYHTQRKYEPKKYVPHKCGPKCIRGIKVSPDDLKRLSPLSIPLLCGWHRQLCKFSKSKKVILYQTPCGIRLRNMEELHRYLRTTNSTLSVDLFDFDYWVRAFADFIVEKCFINIKDLSYGVENVPIPCVNDLDHTQPDTIRYTTRREPTEGVNLNLDPAFLCSCDCEDDCQDKTKCQCWQLTIQGATLGGKVANTAVGYIYKRLPEPVTTGIYECNSGCKCSVKTCLNRVVQHPLRLKLQVFKTGPRGWGIRCLNDIPHGAFICIYAGRLLTEQGANEGGKNYGDEYLAELDYVEVVEGFKEGYESDVLESEMPMSPAENDNKKKATGMSDEEEDNTKESANDSDEDFNIDNYVALNKDIELETTAESSSIRKRLRKRKRNEMDNQPEMSEENSEDGSTKGLENIKSFTSEIQDTINISDDDDSRNDVRREPSRFEPSVEPKQIERSTFKSVRDYFGADEAVYIMDAKTTGNIGRYLNHSCDPNVFVQNVFVDTHDVRFPWVAFFALQYIKAGQELTWNYSYDVGSIPGKVIICKCGAANCRGRLL